jgi:hypothetical protein
MINVQTAFPRSPANNDGCSPPRASSAARARSAAAAKTAGPASLPAQVELLMFLSSAIH